VQSTPAPPPPSASATSTPPSPQSSSTAATAAVAPASANEPAPERSASPSIAPWVLVGVGGTALVAGVVVFLAGAGDISKANGICNLPGNKCPSNAAQATAQPILNKGYALENVGGTVAGVGLAAGIIGVVWGVSQPKSATSSTLVLPFVSNTGAGVALSSRF
jgi:hypothetical protein